MKVTELMTRDPLTVSPNDTIGQADELLAENHIRQLPVVEKGELTGIITDRDIRSFLSGRLFGSPDEREKTMNTKVSAVMSPQPISVSAEDELIDVVELLIEEKIGGIPVVDMDGALVGIVTYVDALRCLLDLLHEEG